MSRRRLSLAVLPLLLAAAPPPPAVEVWVRDGYGRTLPDPTTVALRNAVAAAVRGRAPAAGTPPRILYLADDARRGRRRQVFHYTAEVTDRAFRQTVTITGRCRTDDLPGCARRLLRKARV